MTHFVRSTLLFVCLTCVALAGFASNPQKIPLVYSVENTGAKFKKPVLPVLADLPKVEPLTDPFMWSSTDPYNWKSKSKARSVKFKDWAKRRAEIGWEIQHYEIGPKPVKPDTMSAVYENNLLTIQVTENGKTLTLTCKVVLPKGEGPFPAIIGMNNGAGSLPVAIFNERNIAQITFSHNQVTTYYRPSNQDSFYQMYPNQNIDNSGQYGAWAWGVSRIIDGLELCRETLPIDLKHLAVSGCSYAGKMALFAGAFDERIALTIAQESGGGGVASWRVSQTLGKVEKLGATSHEWFAEHMFQFSDENVSKLPMDHHELCAMIAPRALLFFGNPDYEWLADESGYVSIQAAREVWKTFGIEDRCGFSILGGHGHCQLPNVQHPDLIAFVDKFLLGVESANTRITKSIYEKVDHKKWFQWWGSNQPYFPKAK